MRPPLWSNKIWVALFVVGCQTLHSPDANNQPIALQIPTDFSKLIHPADNEPTEARIQLGRLLFYHTGLSANQSTHCGSCHVLSSAFTDGRSVSPGDDGAIGLRNAPTLANLAWAPYLMAEGGVPSLELQALAPLHVPHEMGNNMMDAVTLLNEDDWLRALNKIAYNRDSIDPFTITRALACFQRTLISGDSKYDQAKHQQIDLTALEKRGQTLFFSEELACGSCHKEPFFTDYGFYNIGLYNDYPDPGLERKTHAKLDSGKFKTPTLRNIALTAPFMHDGSINTLEEVVAHYNSGGKLHSQKDQRIRPLHLSDEDAKALVAFMQTLTDWNFVQNQNLTPPIR
jgi:cytochrome c peroxidase